MFVHCVKGAQASDGYVFRSVHCYEDFRTNITCFQAYWSRLMLRTGCGQAFPLKLPIHGQAFDFELSTDGHAATSFFKAYIIRRCSGDERLLSSQKASIQTVKYMNRVQLEIGRSCTARSTISHSYCQEWFRTGGPLVQFANFKDPGVPYDTGLDIGLRNTIAASSMPMFL